MAIQPAVPHTPGTWRLIYFDAPNRGEQVRMLFSLAKVDFVDVRISQYPEGLNPYKTAAMGDASPLRGTDKCPAVTAPDGTHFVETSEIMKIVGERVGLGAGTANEELAMRATLKAQELINTVFYALMRPVVTQRVLRRFSLPLTGLRCLEPCLGAGAASTKKGVAAMFSHLPTIEALLEEVDGPYVCGASFTYADVALFCTLHQCLSMHVFRMPRTLDPFPKTKAFYTTMESVAELHFQTRVAKQLGYRDGIDFLAVQNTPFPWYKNKQK